MSHKMTEKESNGGREGGEGKMEGGRERKEGEEVAMCGLLHTYSTGDCRPQ